MPAKMKEYTANITFGLNFEDTRVSVKVQKGESVLFDGDKAAYTNKAGNLFEGRAPSLNSAITKMKWLTSGNGKSAKPASETAQAPKNQETYDEFKGGEFDQYTKRSMNLEKEDRRIVKETDKKGKAVEPPKTGEKLEVAGDQVAVKEDLVVTSSTSVARESTHSKVVVASDQYGAEGTIPMKSQQGKEEAPKKKDSFTVDATTPRVAEDATKDEIQRITGVQLMDESQDAKVVGRVRDRAEVQQVDGITLTQTDKAGQQEVDTSVKVGSADKEIDASVTVSKGSEAASDLGAGLSMEDLLGEEGAQETGSEETGSEETGSEEVPPEGGKDYLSMLPEGWGKLHWVKKEKFVKELDDKGFLEFILTVETSNAIQKACKERLEELG